MSHLFSYKWYLKDGYPAKGIGYHGKKVFSTFACGGGSTMGYKLAGYDVIGANDIDPQMAKVYKENHHPEIYELCDIRTLNKKIVNKEVDKRLFDLDILDGSPPCSTFSMAGSREKAWGKEKKFREGQAMQTLDDLFFDFIKTTKLLQPRIILGENVSGMIKGNAKGYLLEIKKEYEKIGYNIQLFLFNAASMGVPQIRERVFVIGYRNDLNLPSLKLSFNEDKIIFGKIKTDSNIGCKKVSNSELKYWKQRSYKDANMAETKERIGEKYTRFTTRYEKDNRVLETITASDNNMLYSEPRKLNNIEYCLGGSFPLDYNFMDIKPRYLVGMSVPPVMTAQISNQIYKQYLNK